MISSYQLINSDGVSRLRGFTDPGLHFYVNAVVRSGYSAQDEVGTYSRMAAGGNTDLVLIW